MLNAYKTMFGGRTRSKNKLLHAFGFCSRQAWRVGIVALLYIGANLYDKVLLNIFHLGPQSGH